MFKADGTKSCVLFHHKDRAPNSYAIKNSVKNIEEIEEEIPDLNKLLSIPPENRIILFDESLQGHQGEQFNQDNQRLYYQRAGVV